MQNQTPKVYPTYSKADYDFFKKKGIPVGRIEPTYYVTKNEDTGKLKLIKNEKDGK